MKASRWNLSRRSSIYSQCISSYTLRRNYFKFCQGDFQKCRNRNLLQILDIASTSKDIEGFSHLSTNFTLSLIIFGSKCTRTRIKLLPHIWLCNNCDAMNTRNGLFLETTEINQLMQFSIDVNKVKLLFIHLILTQYDCLSVRLPFHCNINSTCLSFWFPYKEVSRFWMIIVFQILEKLICSKNLELCESFWRHTFESSQVHESMIRVQLRVRGCRSEILDLPESSWRNKIKSFRVPESLVMAKLRVKEVHEEEFGVALEFLEEYDWEFSYARASGDCKIESFRSTWMTAQTLKHSIQTINLRGFQFHPSKTPGMRVHYIPRGTPWLLERECPCQAIFSDPEIIRPTISKTANNQLHSE